MTRKTRSAEIIEEFGEPVDLASAHEGRVFDFAGPVDGLDDETKRVYYSLRRVAIIAGDESRLPDGKTFTEAEVIETLGEDYLLGLVIDKKCCG